MTKQNDNKNSRKKDNKDCNNSASSTNSNRKRKDNEWEYADRQMTSNIRNVESSLTNCDDNESNVCQLNPPPKKRCKLTTITNNTQKCDDVIGSTNSNSNSEKMNGNINGNMNDNMDDNMHDNMNGRRSSNCNDKRNGIKLESINLSKKSSNDNSNINSNCDNYIDIKSLEKMSMGELINHAKMHNIKTPIVLETKKRSKYKTGLSGKEKKERRYGFLFFFV